MKENYWGYKGKQVVIDGAASGMGLAATEMLLELGAEIYALDVKEVPVKTKKYIPVDLGKKASIDEALQQLPRKVDSIFCCAGLPGPPFSDVDTVMVNFVGHRHLIESLLPRLDAGGAIAIISSLGGANWRANLSKYRELLATPGFDEARAWLKADPARLAAIPGGGYTVSKECINAYVRMKAGELIEKGIRINSLSPASTATPLLSAFIAAHGEEMIKSYAIGRYATAEEMGHPLVFLNSNMASFINGVDLQIDNGFMAIAETQMLSEA
ncbi:MAG: SDR family oxidoreductase [Pseudomonadota bacterium]